MYVTTFFKALRLVPGLVGIHSALDRDLVFFAVVVEGNFGGSTGPGTYWRHSVRPQDSTTHFQEIW